jgi:imidazolonepropionase
MKKLLGPFKQIITMDHLPLRGPLKDEELYVIENGGIVVDNAIIDSVNDFELLRREKSLPVEEISESAVLLPGLIDSHTHICFAGSRSRDYSKKIEGKTYQQILAEGGGIHSTVHETRQASFDELKRQTSGRTERHFSAGITTMEIKSGYGLSFADEVKMLKVIASLNQNSKADLIPTCLSAHVTPKEFDDPGIYLEFISTDILPYIKKENLASRVDIFIEENAFHPREAKSFLKKAAEMGFSLTVHADQFSIGGSLVAAYAGAVSADHLEASSLKEIRKLIENDVIATVLPGASIGLALPFARARKILDEGACLVIASDWNPGSAPMGDLLLQSALLSNFEKLSFAETFAGLTFRAAKALELSDRGIIGQGKIADLIAFPTDDYREILYNQGMLKPDKIWKNGNLYSQ